MNNFPIDILNSEEVNDTLGFTFSEDHTQLTEIGSITHYFNQLFASLYMTRKRTVLNNYKHRTIIIQCG